MSTGVVILLIVLIIFVIGPLVVLGFEGHILGRFFGGMKSSGCCCQDANNWMPASAGGRCRPGFRHVDAPCSDRACAS
jgi:hypothetical protein